MMERSVQPEILDHLPACNLDAVASRRDLRTINFLMGNFRWIASQVRTHASDGAPRILELGAGDGALARRIMRQLKRCSYTALDLVPQPDDWPESARWLRRDCLDYTDYNSHDLVLTNLFLHHFKSEGLQQLGARLTASPIRMIIACEPCRRPLHKQQLRAGRLIGFNHVTLNDGRLSVDAGFRGEELPRLLELSPSAWSWKIHETLMGAYRMCAFRR